MRLAVIGTGIAGMVAAFLLCQDQEVVVFEANDYIGGHTNTIDIQLNGRSYPVDSGFIVFNEVTTGASNDLERATKLARAMVTQYGMSEKLGPLTFGEKDELIFLGREISEQRNYSEEIARQIDREVRRLIDEAYRTSKQILIDNRDKLTAIAERLVREETIDAATLNTMFA